MTAAANWFHTTGPYPAVWNQFGVLIGGGPTVRITDACTACGACLATCPERALRRAPRRPLVLDDQCTACWDCVGICPAGAIVEVGA